jgi:hypothetical protein
VNTRPAISDSLGISDSSTGLGEEDESPFVGLLHVEAA